MQFLGLQDVLEGAIQKKYRPSRMQTASKQPGPWTLWMDNARKLIETVFSSLTRKGHLVLGQLNSFRSVRAKVCRKIAAHNFARWLGL